MSQFPNPHTPKPTMYPYRVRVSEGKLNAASERISVLSTELPAEVVATFQAEGVGVIKDGFQRPLDTSRATKIGKLLTSRTNPEIHGGLLCWANEGDITFERAKSSGAHWLTIHKPLHYIDGQHRGGGDIYAVSHGVKDFTESVRIIQGATMPEMAMTFLRCNIQVTKVQRGTVIQDTARMEGTVERVKTWVARMVVALASNEPFDINGESLVRYATGRGRVSAQTLYRTVDLLLPDELNIEGPTEVDALKFAWRALTLYADLTPNWGEREEPTDKIAVGAFKPHDAYTFTMMTAFARLHRAAYAAEVMRVEGEGANEDAVVDIDNIEATIRKAFEEADLVSGLPTTFGSGEAAAREVAAYAAGKVGLKLVQLAA